MTEQEIIDFLKKNKEMGIAFVFMPEEVQAWAITNPQEILVYSRRIGQEKGTWERRGGSDYPLHYDSIYALPDSFQLKQEQKSGWFEYEIDKNGNFYSADADDKDGRYYHWSEWNTCLANNKDNLIAFGGWQYKDDKRWYLAPVVKLQDDELWDSYVIEENGEAIPAIPIKIRFLRESQ